VTKPTQQDPAHSNIRVDPPELVKTVLLGGEQRFRYSVDKLRAGSQVTWHHTSSGAGGPRKVEHAGPTSEVTEFASHAGDRELDTSADIDGKRETAASTTLTTPRSPTNIIGMWGELKERGRTPVAHTMQSNEELVLHVELPNVDASVEELNVGFTGGLKSKHWRKLDEKKFEVVLTPRSEAIPGNKGVPNDATGSLVVIPRGVSISSIVAAPISMHIEVAATSKDVFGSRPGTTAIAVNHAVRKWEALYESRMDGVDALMKEIAVVDSVPEDPLWKQLLKGAAMVALNAVSAGVGAGIVKRLMTDDTPMKAARQELVKVLFEGGSAAVVEKGVSLAMSKAEADPLGSRRTPGGTLLSPKVFFETTQREALREAKLDHATRFESTLTSLTSRLDREQPGSGYRAAVDAHDAIGAQNKLAGDLQISNSLLAWCTFSAQARLGIGDQSRGRDPGTELATQVDVKKILVKGDLPARNLDQTPGVLRLELAEIAPGHIIVVRSFIAGFTGDTVVKNLARKVQDLPIPIVARFNERNAFGDNTMRGFVIGRNENGAVIADSKGALMQDMFGGKSDHEAAALIFEQIAHQTINPERG